MKSLWRIAVAAAALIGAAAVAQAAEPNIIIVSHGQANDPFWNVVKNGATEAAKQAGVHLEYRSPERFDMVKMGQLIDAAVNQKPDGLIVTIPDASALSAPIKKAVAAGIPVISMNSGSDVSKSLGAMLHVGQDEFTAGKAAGAKMKELGGKNAICVNHEVGNVALDERCKGFAEGFGGTVKVIPTGNDPSEVSSKVKAALSSDATVDSVMTLSAGQGGEPTLASMKAMGSKAHLGCFDLSATILKAIAAGEVSFAVDQQQYLQGYLPVIFLAGYVRDGLMPGGDVPSGPNLITKDKASKVIELSAKGIR